MILADVNVLVYAYREDAVDHRRYRDWLLEQVGGEEPFALSDAVLSAFLRIVTHARIFTPPTPIEPALAFVEGLRAQHTAVQVVPGRRHWEIFARLCRDADARGNLIPDAYLSALAIESGCELVTTDRDFSRFPGLRWRHPLG